MAGVGATATVLAEHSMTKSTSQGSARFGPGCARVQNSLGACTRRARFVVRSEHATAYVVSDKMGLEKERIPKSSKVGKLATSRREIVFASRMGKERRSHPKRILGTLDWPLEHRTRQIPHSIRGNEAADKMAALGARIEDGHRMMERYSTEPTPQSNEHKDGHKDNG